MHYYSHHIGDFVRDTSRLNDAQCMAYLRLMWLYYENEQPLQDDIKILAFKIGSDENTVAMLLQCYFYANALHWQHKRIDEELNKYKNKSELARSSAKSRWNNANAMRTHTESNAKAMLTKNQEPITINKSIVVNDVDNCPHIEIINLYKQIIPSGIQPLTWSGSRANQLKARWRENKKRQNLEWWKGLFEYITKSQFLMGQTSNGERKPFTISLDWIVKADNFMKITEGKYHA